MNKFSKLILAGLFLLGGMQTARLHAIPANPAPIVKLLPDGSSLTVRLFGDEAFHYYATEDGYPLCAGTDGWFRYARFERGRLVPTEVKATAPARRNAAEVSFLRSLDKDTMRRSLANQWATSRTTSKLRAVGKFDYPTKGKQRALAILVEFPKIGNGEGVSFTLENPRQLFSDMLNLEDFDQYGATGSVHDYYYDNSNGQFDLTFDVYGPVTVSNDISYYGNDETRVWEMIVEACEKLDGEIDFTEYDRNKDGIIDNVYAFYAGQGEANGGGAHTIWQHASDVEELTGRQYLFDGVRLNHYACSNELRRTTDPATGRTENTLEGIGTVCHEFTHVLGFPDLYNTEDQSLSFTPGSWSLMDMGSYNNDSHTPPCLSAYERHCMGWIDLKELNEPADISLDHVATNTACRISTVYPEEFFVLENRQKKGWDEFLPGHGLLVWHVAYNKERWEYNSVNNLPDYQYIDIEEADDLPTYGTRDGDAFPGTAGVTEFTADTKPSMTTLDGQHRVEVPVTAIEERNGFIYFKVLGGKPSIGPTTALAATDVTPVSFVANWAAKEGATGYRLDVFRTAGEQPADFVEGFRNREVKATSCLVSGLQPGTTYYYRVRATDEQSESQSSEAVSVTTAEATFEYTAPEAAEASAVTATGFTANWSALPEADSYLLSVYTKRKGEADTLVADFNDKALPEGWRTDCKNFLGIAGYYGAALPSLAMTADYNYIETPQFAESVRGISLWYRERNSPDGNNRLVLSGYVDGKWQDLDELALDGSKEAKTAEWSEQGGKIPAGCRALRLTFRFGGKGSLAIDDIRLSYNDNLSPVFLPGFEEKNVGAVTSFAVEGLQPATAYFYTVRGQRGNQPSLPSRETAVATLADPSGIGSLTTPAPRIALNGRLLSVSAAPGSPIAIYAPDGRLLRQTTARGEAGFLLPPGLWLVKVSGHPATKILVD